MTLGMPRLPEAWSNDQVLGFFRLMWQQWLLKSRNGSPETENVLRGPAPPAAVAAAAKIAFTALGSSPEHLFQTEPHEKPMAERAPVEPVGAALLERSDSGTVSVPLFTVSSEVEIHDFVDGESKLAAMVHNARSRQISTVRGPLENPERRNNNLRWLRLHFGSLSDVGRLPFHNADLWQLHQYYFSPPPDETDDDSSASDATEAGRITCDDSKLPLMTSLCARRSTSPDRTVSFHTLSEALSAHGELPSTHGIKRASMVGPEVAHDGPAAKKSKNLKPRIAYYPRIMVSVTCWRIFVTGMLNQTRSTNFSSSLIRQWFNRSEPNRWSKRSRCFGSSSTPRALCLLVETHIPSCVKLNLAISLVTQTLI